MNIRCKELFEAGVQYGHKTQSWNPKMKPFIWGKKESIHLINVALTDIQLTKAEKLLEDIASKGLPILWVGTKKAACKVISEYAQKADSPFFSNRWVGGTLTNWHEVKRAVKKMLLNEEIYQKAESQDIYTKKELNLLQKKVSRSKKIISGIEKLTYPIGALIVADVQKDRVAVKEALRIGIPIIGIVDTNADPEGISIVIPCNDDLDSAISCISKYLSDAILKGKEIFKKNNEIAYEKIKLEQSLEEKKYHNKSHQDEKTIKKSVSANKDFNEEHTEAPTNATIKEIITDTLPDNLENLNDKVNIITENTHQKKDLQKKTREGSIKVRQKVDTSTTKAKFHKK